ncbi:MULTISPECIES: bifunctional hydroxymethylpyrimidine kinase/phosphomethylpyrimidine kinase [unclassified Streptococcus]|uniref:bifunctional hydroxymethylpyrimidine kinase/phosphomethylpyrimidine kinase n=1 Tax=unclassified Streptococcus TaxID=2608887 RepID=UPI001071CA21|nr:MULTISPECIES: bifunctional hydroxymethylpyrimidine kinase/phosphomethylpyrimidine kinase [unclassified Streptococcus]MBF0787942.1 bifunctional hydroxymethylpyrimidine kinase/phosphomethylpyrimidine kinase [Streptococcus sp. 19428wC2_LYSM12]MCQ9211307.1 bifunctional hydroxymethylpyrimidine kinase/phosphomethylpyrimidine kinase [Streptococcus sp. B01]MCQ9214619.1 bifunctional hydroxymethylpyrimidine kinase/phosphomethylpyrimidine kinase [Streptococcus sp. O1]TFV05060.1 bifunctional hydroxymeth
MRSKYIVALSGNDIFSGGGLHADLTTYTVNGLHGFVVVTCLTAMTETGFEVFPVEEAVFEKQVASLQEVDFAAIKVGLLPNIAIAKQALNMVRAHTEVPIVLDPVLVCKETHDVEVNNLRDELLAFLPYVTIVTPNLVEAELLTQRKIQTVEEMKEAARALHERGVQHVVIKGGNRLDQMRAIDVYYDGIQCQVLESQVLDKNNTGAGCTFASSIASQLALGTSVFEAVKLSKDFVYRAIQASDEYGVVQYEN